jgi:hypothetical protein
MGGYSFQLDGPRHLEGYSLSVQHSLSEHPSAMLLGTQSSSPHHHIDTTVSRNMTLEALRPAVVLLILSRWPSSTCPGLPREPALLLSQSFSYDISQAK